MDDRLKDCLASADLCAEKGVVDESVAFALMRQAYGTGYLDAHREMPDDPGARRSVADAWASMAASAHALVKRMVR